MASLSIQFFATTDELAAFATRVLESGEVHAAAIVYQPYKASRITRHEAAANVHNERVRRLIFTEQPVDCSVSGNNQLLDQHEGALVLDIGRISPRGVIESRLSTTHGTTRWRKVAADLKRTTAAGMVGTNEQNGATAKYRAHRYTPGAAAIEQSGTALRPFDQSPVSLRPDR
jgi:hypothetical protein